MLQCGRLIGINARDRVYNNLFRHTRLDDKAEDRVTLDDDEVNTVRNVLLPHGKDYFCRVTNAEHVVEIGDPPAVTVGLGYDARGLVLTCPPWLLSYSLSASFHVGSSGCYQSRAHLSFIALATAKGNLGQCLSRF